jgi:hypothetical protein
VVGGWVRVINELRLRPNWLVVPELDPWLEQSLAKLNLFPGQTPDFQGHVALRTGGLKQKKMWDHPSCFPLDSFKTTPNNLEFVMVKTEMVLVLLHHLFYIYM